MVKKRLSDLLREEVQKDSADEPAAAAAKSQPRGMAKAKTTANSASGSNNGAKATTVNSAAHSSQAVTAEPVVDAGNVVDTGNNVDTTKLEAQIAELQAALGESQTTLKQKEEKVAALQVQLNEQQKAMDGLKGELQKSEQLQKELAEAKELILKLSAPVPQAARSPSPYPPIAASKAAEPELESSSNRMVAKPLAAPPGMNRDRPHQVELRKILDHPTQPGDIPYMPPEEFAPVEVKKPLPKPPETDMGWVD